MAVIDCIVYNRESELFDLRYNILKDYVDEFIVVEFDKTFSGKAKQFYFDELIGKYEKVKFYQKTDWGIMGYEKYRELAEFSPNTVGAEHWKREFAMKESIKDCLTHLKDDDIVFVSDCDEIWNPESFIGNYLGGELVKLKLKVYSYWLNNRSDEQFWGTIVGKYKLIKYKCLNHLRTNTKKTEIDYGWHFTSMGGYEKVRQKLEDSYTKETYASDVILDNLEGNIAENKDFLGRNYTYWIDESNWPQYLKDNKQKYLHLCK